MGEIRSWARKTGSPRERKVGGWKEQEFICNRKGQIQMQKREDTARGRESERERTRACARERERAKEILRKREERRETVREIVREKESMCMYVQEKEKERKRERERGRTWRMKRAQLLKVLDRVTHTRRAPCANASFAIDCR